MLRFRRVIERKAHPDGSLLSLGGNVALGPSWDGGGNN